jgi:hypothetical protein
VRHDTVQFSPRFSLGVPCGQFSPRSTSNVPIAVMLTLVFGDGGLFIEEALQTMDYPVTPPRRTWNRYHAQFLYVARLQWSFEGAKDSELLSLDTKQKVTEMCKI